jgi:tRNA/tmRNA/rRNA uracil-C5-methylase (TrmA/RlmC/RlmD family)
LLNSWWNQTRVSDLSLTYGQTYDDDLWPYVLLSLPWVQRSPQLKMLHVQARTKKGTLYFFLFRWKSHKLVHLSLLRVLLPRSNEIIKYLCRTTDAFEWAKRRELGNIRPGVIVDFQDSFNIWRRAIVLKTFV